MKNKQLVFEQLRKRTQHGIESRRFVQFVSLFRSCFRRVLGLRFISDCSKTNQATVFMFCTIKRSILSFDLLFTEYVYRNKKNSYSTSTPDK